VRLVVAEVPDDVARAVSAGASFLFLSPHLDDAVLSCGALIGELSGRCAVTVATAFTTAGPPPHTLAARSFLRRCSAGDAATFFAARRAEDRGVLAELGAAHVHLGFPDALFRRRGLPVPLASFAGRLLPELVHRYPTYRFDIAKGRVARGDRALMGALGTAVAQQIRQTSPRLVFCPLGVGRHVDHLLVRALGNQFADRVVYYADFPYNQYAGPDPDFVRRNRLAPWSWTAGIVAKADLIRGYRTQAGALFPDGRIPAVPESYFSARS
jgi:LmbE family N-acetylglucosaminyl deacetylase